MKQVALVIVWLALVSFANIAGCKTGPQPVPTPSQDAAVARTPCQVMCDHMIAMGCKSGQPSPHGIPCEKVCENVQGSGVIKLDLKCLTDSASCNAADDCTVKHDGP